ncbi:MAG: hypothetical protein QM730_25625 [Anaerolineales bacterium]
MMYKQNVVAILYCGLFPLLIGFTLLALPEFFSLGTEPFSRLIRALMTLWLMFGYVSTGISFIPNLESSSIALFNTWRKYYNFRDENHQPRFEHNLFPVYYFVPALVSCAFTSLVLWIAISTFAEPLFSLTIIITVTNFLLLFVPRVVLYRQALEILYGDEPL